MRKIFRKWLLQRFHACFSQEQVKGINKEIRKHIYEKEPDTLTAGGATKKGDFFPIPLSPLLDVLYPWLYRCQMTNRDFLIQFINEYFQEENTPDMSTDLLHERLRKFFKQKD